MRLVAISGGWRRTNAEIEQAVRETVRQVMAAGGGIVTGGALGVDFFATDEALKIDPTARRIRVFLPTTLGVYAVHCRQRAKEGIVTETQAEDLINQLTILEKANPAAVSENPANSVLNDETYFERDQAVIDAADELVAFHVISSETEGRGTMDTISKARAKGLPVTVREFNLTDRPV